MSVDQSLIDEALAALNVADVSEMHDGGQKTVRSVEQAGTELVLKVVGVDSGTPDAVRRAQREVELLKRIDSPYVVKVASDLVELGLPIAGVAWLEECLDGQDLADLIRAPWEWAEVAAMAKDVGLGLSALHELKVVHRDLSAKNVRRTGSGRYVVMDPGFARHTLRSGITIGGQPGTAGFLTPEHLQAYSGAPNASSDVFGVGILMFLTLTGELPIPYTGDHADYLARLSRVEVNDLAVLRPDLSDEAQQLVARCLHPQPARRPLNGQALVDALSEVPR